MPMFQEDAAKLVEDIDKAVEECKKTFIENGNTEMNSKIVKLLTLLSEAANDRLIADFHLEY